MMIVCNASRRASIAQIDQGLKVQAQRMQRSQDELQTSNQALQSQLQELSDKLDGLKERLEED